MEIIIGSDHAGFELKNSLKDFLVGRGYNIIDLGTDAEDSCDYPIFAEKVAKKVAESKGKGILICGTGIGMSIVANKIKGIRAALGYDVESAKLSRQHNDSNILCLGARKISEKDAYEITRIWLSTPFEGGRHQRRLDLITKLEQSN